MRLVIALVLVLAPSIAAADVERAAELRQRCENAWTSSGRERAARELADLGASLIRNMRPMSPSFEQQSAEIKTVTDWLRECTALIARRD